MNEHRVFLWDDQSFHWIQSIGEELHRLRPSWGIRYDNCDSDMDQNLQKDSRWFFREQAKPKGDVSVIFEVFCTRKAESLDFSRFVAAVVDDMFEHEPTLNEKQREHYGTFELAKRIQVANPNAITVVATGHVLEKHIDPAEMLSLAQGSVVMFLDKQDIMGRESSGVRRCVAGLIVAAVARQQAAEAERRMGEENAQLRRGLRVRDEVAHGSFGLLEHVRHLVGLDEAVLHIARTIEPLFQHKTGAYQSLPKVLQRKFPAALMLEGEPGSGKTTLCMAIANSLGIVRHLSPALISPGRHVGMWQKPLRECLTEAFLLARDGQTVVIKADDIAWPDLSGISDYGLRADWQDLMSFLRLCIRLASAVNNHVVPSDNPLNIQYIATFRGKVLWLFARNEDEMIGEMFAPLKDVLLTVPIVFPKDEASRRRILELYAAKEGVVFSEDALALALKTTANYSGRALIGDDDMGRGFVFWAIAAVKDRETARWQTDNGCQPNMTITNDLVEKWLNGPLHKEAVRLARGNSVVPDVVSPLRERQKEDIAREDLVSDAALSAGVDMGQALALAREIWRTQGACIEHDPDMILTSHGAPCLRIVLALVKGALKRKFGYRDWKKPFDSVFGFGSGKRVSVELTQYLQNLCKQHKDYFPPRGGRTQFGATDVDDDAESLKEAGYRFDVD